MILLEPANTITHFNLEIKRRTISVTPFCRHYTFLFGVAVAVIS